MERLIQDVQFGARVLWRDKAFAATAVLTLAICIGANTALFSVIRSVLLRPLPFPHPEQLVFVFDAFPNAGVPRAGTSVPNYLDRRAQVGSFAEQALYRVRGLNVGEGEAAERVRAMECTPSLFPLLKVEASVGRTFTDEEGERGKHRRVILGQGIWQRLFAGDRAAIGRDLRVNGAPFTIVGVMPGDFVFVDPEVELWIPGAFPAEERSEDARYSQNDDQVARLQPGATIEQAQQQIDALNARNLETAGVLTSLLTNTGYHSETVPVQADLVRNVRSTLYLLWGGVLSVLLIAAVNIANLVLVRSTRRLRELATRHAMGAGHRRLARQLLTETALLTIAGGVLGVALGAWALGWLSWLGLSELPRGHEIRMDGVVVAFTLALIAGLALVIGAVPVGQLAATNLIAALRDEGRSGTAGRGSRLVRRALVTVQVAIAFVLLVGAGLLLSSFQRMLAIDPGFRSDHLLSGLVSLPGVRYADDPAVNRFASQALDRIRALPGVESAGISSALPLSGSNSSSVILAEGYVATPGESVISPNFNRATPGFVEAMGIPLLRGRYFTEADTVDAPRVVIVDERPAKKFWPATDPIGRRMFRPRSPKDLESPGPDALWLQVVGVVGNVRQQELVEGEDSRIGAYYFPYAQDASGVLGFAIRTAGDPVQAARAVRRIITDLDPELPFYDVQPMDERVEQSLDRRRTPVLIALGFAAVALLLATVGIDGVLAYQLGQRTREIGIRMALGGDTPQMFRLVFAEGGLLAGVGLAAGWVGAVALRRAFASQLYGIGPLDPTVLAGVTVTLALAASLACLGPARRATRIDPVAALNQQ